jgi:hypothetical protein
MKKFLKSLFVLLPLFQGCVCLAGPFGFEYGMSKQQVVGSVGKTAVEKDEGETLTLSTAPKPHSAFEKYMCVISPTKGLVKVVALGIDIQTSGTGSELSSSFGEIAAALTANYGEPEKKFDFLHAGSIWSEPQDWMMGLLKLDRTLEYFWSVDSASHAHVEHLVLEAKAISSEKGYLVLSYEFEGFAQYAAEKRAQKDKVF